MSLGPCSVCGHGWTRHLRLPNDQWCKDCECPKYQDSEGLADSNRHNDQPTTGVQE